MIARWVLAFVGVHLLAGCSDPLRDLVNSKWPPLSAEQQRQAAIQSAAQTLGKLTAPNLAVGVQLADAKKVLLNDGLKKLGVSHIDLDGEKQLLGLRITFSRQFTEADAGENADLRKLVAALRPEIAGKIAMYAGLTGGTAAPGAPELELRLLPALSAVRVDKIKLADKVDATSVGELLATLLNRYKDNVSGELTRASFTRVAVPVLAPKTLDVTQSFKVADAGVAATVEVKGNPVTVPFRLDGVAWLVTDKELTALVQLVPAAPLPPGFPAPVPVVLEPTFDAVKARVGDLIRTAFDVPNADSSTWVAIRKDLLATATNNVVSQAGLCVSAVAETPSQHVSVTIPMPKADDISCAQNTPCNLGSCTFHMEEDRRGCGSLDLGCRLAQGIENDRRRAAANAEVVRCQASEGLKKGVCELGKINARGLCEAAKAGLKLLGPNFANVETDFKARTNGVQACLRDFALSPSLDKVQFALDVQGKALVDINVKFTPLDIAGHLFCQFPWSKPQAFEASLRDARFGISSPMQFVVNKDVTRVDFATEPISLKAKLSPSPVEYLFNSQSMRVACPIVNAATPLVVSLTPFVKELRGDIDYTLPPQKASLDLALPTQTVGGSAVASKVLATSQALVVTGVLVDTK